MSIPRAKSLLPEKNVLRGGRNPGRCIKQDSEPNTLPTSFPGPLNHPNNQRTNQPSGGTSTSQSTDSSVDDPTYQPTHSSQTHKPTATHLSHRLVGPVVKVSASRAADPGFDSRLRRDFSGSSHTSDIGTPVATLALQGSALGLVGQASVHCGWVG